MFCRSLSAQIHCMAPDMWRDFCHYWMCVPFKQHFAAQQWSHGVRELSICDDALLPSPVLMGLWWRHTSIIHSVAMKLKWENCLNRWLGTLWSLARWFSRLLRGLVTWSHSTNPSRRSSCFQGFWRNSQSTPLVVKLLCSDSILPGNSMAWMWV